MPTFAFINDMALGWGLLSALLWAAVLRGQASDGSLQQRIGSNAGLGQSWGTLCANPAQQSIHMLFVFTEQGGGKGKYNKTKNTSEVHKTN